MIKVVWIINALSCFGGMLLVMLVLVLLFIVARKNKNLKKNKQQYWEDQNNAIKALLHINKIPVFPKGAEILADSEIDTTTKNLLAEIITRAAIAKGPEYLFASFANEKIKPLVSKFVVRELVKGSRVPIAEVLKTLADNSTEAKFRCDIAETLGEIKNTESIPTLILLFRDESLDITLRRTALTALGRLRVKEIVPDLIEILELQKPKPSNVYRFDEIFRSEIFIDVLKNLDDKTIFPYLRDLLADKTVNSDARKVSVSVLVALDATQAIPVLSPILEDFSETLDFRATVAKTLLEFHVKEPIPGFESYLESLNFFERMTFFSIVDSKKLNISESKGKPAFLRTNYSETRISLFNNYLNNASKNSLEHLIKYLRRERVKDNKIIIGKALLQISKSEKTPVIYEKTRIDGLIFLLDIFKAVILFFLVLIPFVFIGVVAHIYKYFKNFIYKTTGKEINVQRRIEPFLMKLIFKFFPGFRSIALRDLQRRYGSKFDKS